MWAYTDIKSKFNLKRGIIAMKMSKWNEKVCSLMDKLCMDNNIKYFNQDDGALFCDNTGTWLLFSPGSVVLSADSGKNSVPALADYWKRVLESSSTLARENVSGWLNGMKCRKFENDDTVVYVREKFLRMFPKNTMFYLQSTTKPIIAGIWENGKLNVIGFVMPVYPKSEFVMA
jgi:hypothetical protein